MYIENSFSGGPGINGKKRGVSTFPRMSELEHHHQMQISVIPWTLKKIEKSKSYYSPVQFLLNSAFCLYIFQDFVQAFFVPEEEKKKKKAVHWSWNFQNYKSKNAKFLTFSQVSISFSIKFNVCLFLIISSTCGKKIKLH